MTKEPVHWIMSICMRIYWFTAKWPLFS